MQTIYIVKTSTMLVITYIYTASYYLMTVINN